MQMWSPLLSSSCCAFATGAMVNNAIKTIQSDDFMVSLSSRSDFAAKILGEPGGVSPRTSRVIRSRPGANAHRLARERVGQDCPNSKTRRRIRPEACRGLKHDDALRHRRLDSEVGCGRVIEPHQPCDLLVGFDDSTPSYASDSGKWGAHDALWFSTNAPIDLASMEREMVGYRRSATSGRRTPSALCGW